MRRRQGRGKDTSTGERRRYAERLPAAITEQAAKNRATKMLCATLSGTWLPQRQSRGGIIARKNKNGATSYYARYIDADGKRKNRLVSVTSMEMNANDELCRAFSRDAGACDQGRGHKGPHVSRRGVTWDAQPVARNKREIALELIDLARALGIEMAA